MNIEQIYSEENVRLAIKFVIDSLKNEFYYDPAQHYKCANNQEYYVKKISKKLRNNESYKPNIASKIIKHKGKFAIRNIILLDIDDIIIRTSIALVIANEIEQKLIDNCFSYKRGEQINKNDTLFEDFASIGWENFCNWQHICTHRYNLLLKTDISSFFDSISHEIVISSIKKEMYLSDNDPIVDLVKKVLKVKHIYNVNDTPVEILHGLTVGTLANHVFANLILNQIDHYMSSLANVSYGRYVDDIRIFGNNEKDIKNALENLQIQLFDIGLGLNGAKTCYAGNKDLFDSIKSDRLNSFYFIEDNDDFSNFLNYKDSVLADDNKSLKEHNLENLQNLRNKDLINDNESAMEYCHCINNAIFKDIRLLDRTDITNLYSLLTKSYKCEKFVCWILFNLMSNKRINENSRENIANKVLSIMASNDISFFAIVRLLSFFFYRKINNPYIDYSVIDKCIKESNSDNFKKIITNENYFELAFFKKLLNIIPNDFKNI